MAHFLIAVDSSMYCSKYRGKSGRGAGKSNGGGGGGSNGKKGGKPQEKTGKLVLHPIKNFAPEWRNGNFSRQATEAVEKEGFDIEKAVQVSTEPIGGRTRSCVQEWKTVSDSKWVHKVAEEGYRIDWMSRKPNTPHRSGNPPTDEEGKKVLDHETEAMLLKGAIREVAPSQNEVVSGYFARPKKTKGKFRPIVSLKYTNRFIRKQKFRMTTPADIKAWIKEDWFFTSIDLADAYFTIPLHREGSRFTRFKWRQKTFEYLVIMFGLGPSARVFTKMLRPVLKFIRRKFNIWILAYIDDLIIQAVSAEQCYRHAEIVILILQCLGYGVNFEKSSLVPSKEIEHLGFTWDSRKMTVSIPQVKVDKITERAGGMLKEGKCTANQLRSLLGTLESTRLVTKQAALHYRGLQRLMPRKRGSKFPGNKILRFPEEAKKDLRWWNASFATAPHTSTSLREPIATNELHTDASGLVGWGGHDARGKYAQGQWEQKEALWHINLKEIEAVRKTLQSTMLAGDVTNLNIDSMVAVAYINKQGGTRSRILCQAAIRLWRMVLRKKGWIRAFWTPREENEQADMLSKSRMEVWDFGLKPTVAAKMWERWFTPRIDLFGSSRFHLADSYYSGFPDSQAKRQDAFGAMKWPEEAYAFPPPPLLRKTLDRIRGQKGEVIMVMPRWTEAAWWDTAMSMMRGDLMELGWAKDIMVTRAGERLPRMGKMVACLLRGN